MVNKTTLVPPGSFKAEAHWYPKALNATIHPMVSFFLNLDRERIVSRYCHLNPLVDPDGLRELLAYQCKYFLWGGADLINATTAQGRRRMVIIENNSCPSGQKSMPLLEDHKEEGSYRLLVERTFKPMVERRLSKKTAAWLSSTTKTPWKPAATRPPLPMYSRKRYST